MSRNTSAPALPRSELPAVSVRDGRELGRWPFAGEATFDGMSAAAGRLYLVTHDGRILCFASDRGGE